MLAIQGPVVQLADLLKDLLLAARVVQSHARARLQVADLERMHSAVVQQRYDLGIDLIDLGAVFLDLRDVREPARVRAVRDREFDARSAMIALLLMKGAKCTKSPTRW